MRMSQGAAVTREPEDRELTDWFDEQEARWERVGQNARNPLTRLLAKVMKKWAAGGREFHSEEKSGPNG